MHRKQPIATLVYSYLYPHPRPDDPSLFSAHLSKYLVPEVRIETATFYGSLETIEARYPGLNYSHAPHRKRLGRFPHHRRLFQAFDDLGLTDSEIAGFCRWEGTLWARERYERDEGIKVKDTTGEEIGPWVDNRRQRKQKACIKVTHDIEVAISSVPSYAVASTQTQTEDVRMGEDSQSEESEEELESVGVDLNQRLMEQAREQGHSGPDDSDWEQILKDMREREQLGIALQRTQQATAQMPSYMRAVPPMWGAETAPSSSNVH